MNKFTPTKDNVFFFCYLVELLMRHTLNSKPEIIKHMSRDYVLNILENEECYHVLPKERLICEQVEELKILKGRFNPVDKALYRVPPVTAMARLYAKLIFMMDGDVVDNIFKVFSSDICNFIDDYNSSLYYENPEYIKECILVGEIIRL